MMNVEDKKTPIINIFQYLEEVFSSNTTIQRDIRSFQSHEQLFELNTFPKSENIVFKKLNENIGHSQYNNILLSVWKEDSYPSEPPLPKELHEWTEDISNMKTSRRTSPPRCRAMIFKKIQFDSEYQRTEDFQELLNGDIQEIPESLQGWVEQNHYGEFEKKSQREIPYQFSDFPELKILYDEYVTGPWNDWKEEMDRIEKINKIYDDLYQLRSKYHNAQEKFDLFFTHDLITWKINGKTLYYPLMFTPVEINFYGQDKKIDISIAPYSQSFLELSFLQDLDLQNSSYIQEKIKKYHKKAVNLQDVSQITAYGQEIIADLSSDSINNFPEETSDPKISEKPTYWYYPLLLLREKSSEDWSIYARKIQENIQSTDINDIPSFLQTLSGIEQDRETTQYASKIGKTDYSDGELYFPLPTNTEQREIAQKIDRNSGVVIQGPPGTGKSHTIANLISRFLSQGKSVLVTSKTGKALNVLKEKIPDMIQDLVISYVDDSISQQQMSSAVSTIQKNLNDSSFTQEEVTGLEEELKEVRKEKQMLQQNIKYWIDCDRKQEFWLDGEKMTPEKAAKELAQGQEKGQYWIEDTIDYNMSLPFSKENLSRIVQLLASLIPKERNLFTYDFPDTEKLPSIQEVDKMLEMYQDNKSCLEPWDVFLTRTQFFEQEGITKDNTQRYLETINRINKSSRSVLNTEWKEQLCNLLVENIAEYRKWKEEILPQLEIKSQDMRELNTYLHNHEVVHNTSYSQKDLLYAINELQDKLDGNDFIPGWKKVVFLSKTAKDLDQGLEVDPDDVTQKQALELLDKQLRCEQIITQVEKIWSKNLKESAISEIEGFGDPFVLSTFETELQSLRNIIDLAHDINTIQDFQQSHTLNFDLKQLKSLFEAVLAKFEIQNLQYQWSQWKNILPMSPHGHPIFQEIHLAINAGDFEAFHSLYGELKRLDRKRKESKELNVLREKITTYVPKLYKTIEQTVNTNGTYHIPEDLSIAWRLARIASWLDDIHSQESLSKLQNRFYEIENREKDMEKKLIATKAWTEQKRKVTESQQQALAAYVHAIQKMPRTYSAKTRPHWEQEAREALQTAKNAVPVWIMPLDKIVRMFTEPSLGMFDVVIVDEASQVDITGINIASLGKKIIVVGDPEQISPTSFKQHEMAQNVREKYLSNMKYEGHLTLTSSLFDIANIMFTAQVMLREHFRSREEIINFSNKLAYDGKLQMLKSPHPNLRLDPPLEAIYVEEGYMNRNNKVNEPEAEAVVQKLKELFTDPLYGQRMDGNFPTFGIVTLLGTDQGRYIHNLIHEQIDKEEIEKRNISVGNPYEFQGDERDVMLISMVKASDLDNPNTSISPMSINKKENKQLVNVAMSRAKEKQILFHSLKRDGLKANVDLRAQIIDWFYNTKKEEIKWGRGVLKEKNESPFELEVGNIILNQGYKVIPQFEVAGYRIDLVIQGEYTRLAVECDGDAYHGPDKWKLDFEREQILRRAGWEFWRITGSSFYRYREDALQSLWTKLDEMDIKPIE